MGLFIATNFKQNNIFFDFFYTKNEYNNKKKCIFEKSKLRGRAVG